MDIIGEGGHILSPEELARLSHVIRDLSISIDGMMGRTSLLEHKIETGDATPIKQRSYPVSLYIQKDIDTEIDRMLRLNM